MENSIDISCNPSVILESLQDICKEKRKLVKIGKIFKRKLIRYFILRNEYLIYFTKKNSTKCKGSINLIRSISIPIKSPLTKHNYCIKVATSDLRSEFYIFPLSSSEQSLFLLYFKLASNGEIQQALEKYNLNTIDQEIQLLSGVTIFKYSKSYSNSISNVSIHEEKDTQPVFIEKKEFSYEKQMENDYSSEEIQTGMVPALVYPLIQSAPLTKEDIRDLGIKCLWNFDLDSARSHFENIKKEDLRSVLHCAEVNLFKVLVTGRKSDVILSSESIQEAEQYFSTTTEGYSDIILAEISLLKSVLLLVSGQKLKAFITMRSAWKNFRKYEISLSKITDSDILGRAYFGLGLFMLVMSLVPASISTILRLAGFASNREKGLEYLYKCKSLNVCRSPTACIILGLYYIDMEPDFTKAQKIIQECLETYPSCVLFYWISSVVSWKLNKVDSAVGLLNTALDCCGKDLASKAAFIKYELGWFYFLRLEWKQSRKQFQEILIDTLSLSSELDSFVKEALVCGEIAEHRQASFETLYNRGISSKKNTKASWIDSKATKRDRVFIPHKSCLIAQLAGCLAALDDKKADFWLKVTKISAGTPTASRTKLDEEFGTLAECFLKRKHKELLPYEIIYFLKQHTKLLPNMLTKIYYSAESVINSLPLEKTGAVLTEWISAKMLQIMALSLNGDTSDATEIADEVIPLLKGIPEWGRYVVPHTLYWCSRAYGAELRFEEAISALNLAQKHKNYSFNIRGKILKVLDDMKHKLL
jgi:tetratricopeptide (TPR) repeat protein